MMKKILLMMALAFCFQFANAQTINDANILLFLDFEDDFNDNSPGVNFAFARKATGTASGAGGNDITYSETRGKFGKYGIFNNTVYESANSDYNTENSSTISVWLRIGAGESIVNGQISHVLDMANGPLPGTADDGTAQIRLRSGGAGDNNFASATTAVEQYSNTVAAKEEWYHIALVHDAVNDTQTFYINGVVDKVYDYSGVATKPRDAQTNLIVGANKVGNTGQAIIADMDDLLITSEVLTISQVQSLMEFGVQASKTGTTSVWTGNGDTDTTFGTAANWSPSGAPGTTANIKIPSGLTNYPVSGSAITVGSIIVEKNAALDVGSNAITASFANVSGGGSLIASSLSGALTYNVITAIDNAALPQIPNPEGAGNIFNPAVWNLMSSPVVGDSYDNDWILRNFIGTGTGANRAIALYDNATATNGGWDYHLNNTTANFDQGIGFSTRKKTLNYQNENEEIYTFQGTYPSSATVALTIDQGAETNWNLVGNPYPAYIKVSDFIDSNSTNITLANRTAYIWNPAAGTYTGLVKDSDYIAPGQGFFVNAATSTAGNFVISKTLSHQTSTPFYKTSAPKISLSITDGDKTRVTQLSYGSNNKLGLDPGFDIGMFTGVKLNFNVYTSLLEGHNDVAFERQALPDTDFETMIVPVGVIAKAGSVLTFSSNAQNLPSGIDVYLEDRVKSTYTKISGSDVQTLTVNDALNGTGRFYLHTSASSVLNTDDILLSSVNIYKTDNSNLRIAGLKNGLASVEMYNVLGKRVFKTSFTSSSVHNVSLPSLATGMYIVKLQTESGNISKKIILE